GDGVHNGFITGSTLLRRLADDDVGALRTGDAALHEHKTALLVEARDLEVLHGDPLVAHLTGHLLALDDVTGGEARADGPTVAEVLVHTVGPLEATEAVATDDAAEAATLRGADHVADIALGEDLGDLDLLAGREGLDGLGV